MRVDWVSLVDYRSYPQLEWHPDATINLLIGPNGAGKTNLLEAVSYLGTLKSFRAAPDRALIAEGSDSAVIRAGLTGDDRDRLVEIEIRRQGGRQTQVDKTRLKRTSDLLGVVRAVAFLPEDLDLVKRGPAYRRDLLDDVSVQLWPAAHLDISEFERALRQRNAFLKQGERDDTTLAVWDSRLAQAGGRVLARRARVIETLSPMFSDAYDDIAGGGHETSITYVPSWGSAIGEPVVAEMTARLGEALERSRRNDYERRMTTVGPHRDEPGFSIGGREARIYGSQGEQRTMALAVKLAAHRAVTDSTGDTPVLLLDDVFSELDPERAHALAKALPTETQTLITSARAEDLPIVGTIWKVDDGVHR